MKIEPVRPHVYLDIEIGGEPTGRTVIELYNDLSPNAASLFFRYCTNKDNTLRKTEFHRVVQNFMVAAGGATSHSNTIENHVPNDTEAATSILNTFDSKTVDSKTTACPDTQPIKDTYRKLDTPFNVHMSLLEPDACRFFITTKSQPSSEGEFVVVGRVVHGKSVVREMERVQTDREHSPRPECKIIIVDCGEWKEDDPIPIYNASYDTIGGDCYEEYPEDDSNIDQESSMSVYNACLAIKELGTILLTKGDKRLAILKYKKCLRYLMEYIPDAEVDLEWHKKYMEMKKALFLNLSLSHYGVGEHAKAIDFALYAVDMPNLSPRDKAKAHYRRARAYAAMKQYSEAKADLAEAAKHAPADVSITQEQKRCENLIEQQARREREKYSKFFS